MEKKECEPKCDISGAPIDSHGIYETTRAGESSREMQAQLQRVIKVPLSTIICEYFYVLLIWQRNDGQREIKMPLCAAIYPFVSSELALFSFFLRIKLLELRALLFLSFTTRGKQFLTPCEISRIRGNKIKHFFHLFVNTTHTSLIIHFTADLLNVSFINFLRQSKFLFVIYFNINTNAILILLALNHFCEHANFIINNSKTKLD